MSKVPNLNECLAHSLQDSKAKFEMGKIAFARFLEEVEQMRQRQPLYTPNSSSGYLGNVSIIKTHLYDTHLQNIPRRRLGRGSFSEVDEVEEPTTGQVYAREHILLPDASSGRQTDVLNEVRIMQKLWHQHVASISFCKLEGNSCSIFMKPAGDCDLWQYLETCSHSFDSHLLQPVLTWFGCLLDA